MADVMSEITEAQKKFLGKENNISVVRNALESTNTELKCRLIIQSGGNLFEPPIKGEITLELERSNAPGKLTFTTIKVPNGGMSFHEGDRVVFAYKPDSYNGEVPKYEIIFVGYVFKKSRDRQHHINVTCYDQLRYLKNKYSYVFTNKTATEILKSICDDYGLNVGKLEDSAYKVPAVIKENAEAFDVILTATEETLANTGNMFVLYDKAGEITYENVANLTSGVLICDETAQNFEYTTSIDDETYNSIVLYYKPNANMITVVS